MTSEDKSTDYQQSGEKSQSFQKPELAYQQKNKNDWEFPIIYYEKSWENTERKYWLTDISKIT